MDKKFLPSRSDEPMYWLMFGAGGMVASIVLPSIMVILIIAGIQGDVNDGLLNFDQVSGLFGNWFLSICLFGIVFLLSFYALHRMHHSSHDFGIHSKITWYIAYGTAAVLSFVCLGLQFLDYCKLF